LGLAGLTVPLVGAVQAAEDPFEPYRLTDPAGEAVWRFTPSTPDALTLRT
jgi:hypothetical protein